MPQYKLMDRFGNELSHGDLQKKLQWCKDGEQLEHEFLHLFGSRFGLRLNEQKHKDPTVPDFIHTASDRYVDLKTQNTPFFNARRYGVEPQFAVTLNKIDVDRYTRLYPGLIILYHVNWLAVKLLKPDGSFIEVSPMEGIWAASIRHIPALCRRKNLHSYLQRKADQSGNAKDSYVLDLRNPVFRAYSVTGTLARRAGDT